MKIQVRYFAIFRERLSTEEEVLVLAEGARVCDALKALGEKHEVVAALRGRFQSAVNQEMVGDDRQLVDGDELALIPPVAGGSDRSKRHAQVLDTELSLDRVTQAVLSPGCGGLVTFTGLVRDHSLGRAVERLEYEAYVEMAESVFAKICDGIEAEWPGVRVGLEHRIGKLGIGDRAVVLAAAAPHRAEAFAAARALIDRLKEQAPIWKKETGPDGAEWVGLGP